MMKDFIKVCKQTQKNLKNMLAQFLKNNGYAPIVGDGFIYAPGVEPVCVTAHMDTVHKETVKDVVIENGDTISSPQGIGGDDRCGIYMIMEMVKQRIYPTILFCEDEEIGGVGSDKFIRTEHFKDLKGRVKLFIELDRAHDTDLVYYDDDNKEFHNWCAKITGYKTSYGSFSDISNLCPDAGISGVNISCGYYHAHTLDECVVFSEMEASLKVSIKLIEAARELEKAWEYKEYKYPKYTTSYYSGNRRSFSTTYVFITLDGATYVADGATEEEAVGNLMMDNPNLRWNDIVDWYNEDDFYNGGLDSWYDYDARGVM